MSLSAPGSAPDSSAPSDQPVQPTPAAPLLSGPALQAFLDEAEQAADQQEAAQVDPALQHKALRQLMQGQTCRADDLGTLFRLQRLALRADDAATALHLIDTQGPPLAAALPAAERTEAHIDMAFWRLGAARFAAQTHPAVLAESLAQAEQLLAQLPVDEQPDNAWAHLADQAQAVGDHACARRCHAARHALQLALPQRAAFRAWDQAVLAVRTGQSLAAEGHADAARQSVEDAIQTLIEARTDQDVDHRDWLRLGESVAELAPAAIDKVLHYTRALLPVELSPGGRRDVDVQLARLQAKALAQRAQPDHPELLDQALAIAPQGRYGLTGDGDDDFSRQVLDWLVQAGRTTEAAQLAHESVTCQRPGSSQHALLVAQQQTAQHSATGTPGDFHWHLALACAATHEDMQWVCGEEPPEAYFARHMAAARQTAPHGHPAVAALQARYLVEVQGDHRQALPLLEAAVQHADQADSEHLLRLWLCRFKVLGAKKALALPAVLAASAGWNYNLGVQLDNNLEDDLPEIQPWPEAEMAALATRYYEAGLAQFEAFFASGQGRYRDGDIHVYSMLCNNLALQLRSTPDRAIDLHHRGIATSPFAEHYNGIMSCYSRADNKPAFVDAADRLWHYAQDHGYSRHSPDGYVGDVAHALYTLGRPNEIPIWLQRLDEWWNGLDADDQAQERRDYLWAICYVLFVMSASHPQDVLARLTPLQAELLGMGSSTISYRVANIHEDAQLFPQAVALYQQALQHHKTDPHASAQQLKQIQDGMARCKAQAGASGHAGTSGTSGSTRPWWRFWG